MLVYNMKRLSFVFLSFSLTDPRREKNLENFGTLDLCIIHDNSKKFKLIIFPLVRRHVIRIVKDSDSWICNRMPGSSFLP